MSTSVDTAFIRDYVADFHEVFQRDGPLLANTVRRQTNVVGKSTTFQKIGKGSATTKARHGPVPPMNQDHTAIEVNLEDFYAGDWVDKLDQKKLIHSEMEAIQMGGAKALGRKADDQILTAMDLTSQTISHAAIADLDMCLLLVKALDENDVPDDGRRWGLLTPTAWAALMKVEEFASRDYVGEDLPFRRRPNIKEWNGVKWMRHTGLPGLGTAAAKLFCYHEQSIGHATQEDINVDVTWHGDYQAHFIVHCMSMGAKLIDDTGCIETTHDDTASLPT